MLVNENFLRRFLTTPSVLSKLISSLVSLDEHLLTSWAPSSDLALELLADEVEDEDEFDDTDTQSEFVDAVFDSFIVDCIGVLALNCLILSFTRKDLLVRDGGEMTKAHLGEETWSVSLTICISLVFRV